MAWGTGWCTGTASPGDLGLQPSEWQPEEGAPRRQAPDPAARRVASRSFWNGKDNHSCVLPGAFSDARTALLILMLLGPPSAPGQRLETLGLVCSVPGLETTLELKSCCVTLDSVPVELSDGSTPTYQDICVLLPAWQGKENWINKHFFCVS